MVEVNAAVEVDEWEVLGQLPTEMIEEELRNRRDKSYDLDYESALAALQRRDYAEVERFLTVHTYKPKWSSWQACERDYWEAMGRGPQV